MSEIAYRPEVSSTLIWAIRAVSLSYLGLQMQDKNLIQNSRDIYGKALLKLNKSLQDPVEGLSSDTLSATVLLSFYEFMTCTEKNSWVRHAGGAGKLIRLRGPDRHRTGFGSSVFLSCRYTLMIEAFNSKKPCFLALPEWKQLSRELQENSEFQSPFQTVREDIFQEVVDIPGYVTEAVESLTNDSYDSIALRGLIRRGHKHRSNYKDLHARLVNTLRDAGQEPTMTTSATNNKMFSYVYQYPSNIVGSYYCSHWSLTIMINIVLIGLERKLSELSSPDPPISQHQPEVDANPLPPNQSGRGLPLLWMLTEKARRATPPITTTVGSPSDYPTMSEDDTAHRRQLYMAENIACARETCKSVESMSMSVFLGPMFLVYALRNALRVFSDENEMQWIIGKLAAISKNFGIAKHEIDVFKQQEAGREATFA